MQKGEARKLLGFFKGSKGQLSLDNLMNIFILVVVMAALIPTLVTIINGVLGNVDTITALILSLIPLALGVGVLKAINAYSQPYQAFIRGER